MIYISGKITGKPDYMDDFERGARNVYKMFPDALVFNPATINLFENATWVDYMKVDLRNLLDCNTIYMLRGWKLSKGARVEHYLAKKLGMKIIYER